MEVSSIIRPAERPVFAGPVDLRRLVANRLESTQSSPSLVVAELDVDFASLGLQRMETSNPSGLSTAKIGEEIWTGFSDRLCWRRYC